MNEDIKELRLHNKEKQKKLIDIIIIFSLSFILAIILLLKQTTANTNVPKEKVVAEKGIAIQFKTYKDVEKKVKSNLSVSEEREKDVDNIIKEYKNNIYSKIPEKEIEKYRKEDFKFVITKDNNIYIREKELNNISDIFKIGVLSLTSKEAIAFFAAASTILSILFFLTIIKIILRLIAKMLIFKKAGKPMWGAIVTIYKSVLMLEVANLPTSLILLIFLNFIPIIGQILFTFAMFAINIIIAINLAKSFGKSGWFAFGMVILPTIFYLILGLDSSKYIIKEKNVSKNITKENDF